jgi:hypothetical protein
VGRAIYTTVKSHLWSSGALAVQQCCSYTLMRTSRDAKRNPVATEGVGSVTIMTAVAT